MDDLGDAENSDFFGVGDDFDAGFAHARAAHAEYVRSRTCLQRLRKTRGVHVARSLACRDQDLRSGV